MNAYCSRKYLQKSHVVSLSLSEIIQFNTIHKHWYLSFGANTNANKRKTQLRMRWQRIFLDIFALQFLF